MTDSPPPADPQQANNAAGAGCMTRIVRVPWSADEDEDIKLTYAYANGGFPSFRMQADELNRKYHGGKPVRTSSSVRNREAALLSGSANSMIEPRAAFAGDEQRAPDALVNAAPQP